MSLDQWSQTPASNDLAFYFQTGMAPSNVKRAGWDVMADAAAVISNGSMPTSSGSANAQTITNTRAYGALFTGMWAVFVPGFTNTGAMTLQVDGLTAKNVFANGAAALAGQVVSGIPAWCRYDGTQWQLLNPQRSTGSFTGTITTSFLTVQQTGTVNYAITPDGKWAEIWLTAAITGTSNSLTLSLSGVPAVLSSATNHRTQYFPVEDAGTALAVFANNVNTTTWQFTTNLSGNGFTASGTKGLIASSFAYPLD